MADSFETNVPSDVSMWTVNPLNTDSQANADLFKDLENLSDLPEITTLEELLAYVQENIIRFDTAPKNYKKDDYKSLLKMINRAMFYIYRRDPEITKILNGVYYIGAATTSTSPVADKTARGYNHAGIYTANQAGVYTNFGVTVTENEANQNITFLVPVFDGTTYGASYTKVVYALPHMATLHGDRLFDKISFNVSNPASILLAGQAAWSADEGTLVVGMNGGDVEQSVGFELYLRIKASLNITNGQLLMQDGTDGNSGVIKAKPAEPGCDPKLIIGIATENVSINQLGIATWFGKIRGLNTSAFLPNDELFQSTTEAGALQKTMPTAPNNKSKYAVVINSHATVGTIFIRVQRSQSLNDVNDVDTTDSQSGQPLVKQSDGVWKGSYSTTINEIQPAGGTLSVPDATISTKTVEAADANIGTVVVDTEITAPGYKVESKTDDDFVMANGGTLPISTLKAGIYQLYNPSNNTQIVLEINAAGQVLVTGDIVQNGDSYIVDAEEITTKEQQITLRSDAITGMPIGELAGFVIKMYDGVNDGMIVIDNAGVLRIGDVGDLQPVLTREESPVNQSPLFFNTSSNRAETIPVTTIKTSLVDADTIVVKDSADSSKLKWWSFANIKANLKSYFDPIYVALSGNQTIAGIKTFSSSPIVPTPAIGDSTKVASVEYVDMVLASMYTDNIDGGDPWTQYGGTTSLDFGEIV